MSEVFRAGVWPTLQGNSLITKIDGLSIKKIMNGKMTVDISEQVEETNCDELLSDFLGILLNALIHVKVCLR